MMVGFVLLNYRISLLCSSAKNVILSLIEFHQKIDGNGCIVDWFDPMLWLKVQNRLTQAGTEGETCQYYAHLPFEYEGRCEKGKLINSEPDASWISLTDKEAYRY